MRFFATCARGTEGALRRELTTLRLRAVAAAPGGVSFEGTLEAGMRACLHSRVAMRVLLTLARFEAGDAAALYAGTRAVDWTEWLDLHRTFAVEATVGHSALTHSHFSALKVKDAVVDGLRDRLGARPNVDADDPDVRIVLHLSHDRADLSLDLAGEPLHRRGYRVAMTAAPLKETLAAAVLALGHVAEDLPFVDPMCGSGTLPIEHALRARRIAPGLMRAFGFQRWPSYAGAHQSAWDRMKEEARAAISPRTPAPVLARDVAPKALDAAKRNADRAGLSGDIRFELGDVGGLEAPFPHGTLCANPPYGERLLPEGRAQGARAPGNSELDRLYSAMGRSLRRLHGWRVALLSGNERLERRLGMRHEISHRLWNGPLEARLLVFRVP